VAARRSRTHPPNHPATPPAQQLACWPLHVPLWLPLSPAFNTSPPLHRRGTDTRGTWCPTSRPRGERHPSPFYPQWQNSATPSLCVEQTKRGPAHRHPPHTRRSLALTQSLRSHSHAPPSHPAPPTIVIAIPAWRACSGLDASTPRSARRRSVTRAATRVLMRQWRRARPPRFFFFFVFRRRFFCIFFFRARRDLLTRAPCDARAS
jgi:hypothetical protein